MVNTAPYTINNSISNQKPGNEVFNSWPSEDLHESQELGHFSIERRPHLIHSYSDQQIRTN